MKKAARETTSLETGLRLTGFQVCLASYVFGPIQTILIQNANLSDSIGQIYDNLTSQPVNIKKSYGAALKASDLPEGIARFFPLAPSDPRTATRSSESPSDLTSIPNPSTSASGLPPQTLLPVLRAIRRDVENIRKAIAKIHMRMVGASILVVYEADWVRADEGVKVLEQKCGREGSTDVAIGEEGVEDDTESDGDEDGDDEDEDEDDDLLNHPSLPYVVKVIDFAHTRSTPGQGPDQGVLLGIDTLLRLLDGRIEQVLNVTNFALN